MGIHFLGERLPSRFTGGLFPHVLGNIAKTTSITGNFHDT
jgi:hypothetical protein